MNPEHELAALIAEKTPPASVLDDRFEDGVLRGASMPTVPVPCALCSETLQAPTLMRLLREPTDGAPLTAADVEVEIDNEALDRVVDDHMKANLASHTAAMLERYREEGGDG